MKHPKSSFLLSVLILFLFVSLITCTEEKTPVEEPTVPAETPAPEPAFVLEGDDIVLARVNGDAITRYDLDQSIRSTLGDYAAGRLDEARRQKVLESLVASRAIARVQAANQSVEEKAALDKKVQAYREQLLVKQYLAKHAPPTPVTQEMVREYYESHPERFGAKTIRTYDMIAGTRPLKSEERDALIRVLNEAPQRKDWKIWTETLQGKGYPVAYQHGQVAERLLHPLLRQLMKSLKEGETSRISFIEGKSYVVRIVDEKKIAPRPLQEVSAEIRKALVPVQLKNGVKKASAQVLATAEIVYEK